MNYITAVCPHCGAEFTTERGQAYTCSTCGNVATGEITAYDLSVETGRAMFAAETALRGGDKKGAIKGYKAAAKTDRKNPTPLLGLLFCKHGVKFEKGKLVASDGKSLTLDRLCKKIFKLSDSERKKRYTELFYKIDIQPHIKTKPLKPSNINGFEIKNGVMRYYKGDDENVVIPPSVTRIDGLAFLTARGVKSVHIPASVEKIDERAFTSRPPIEKITVDPASERYVADGGCLIDVKRSAVLRGMRGAVIPDYVTTVDEYAFESCTDLTEIVIPSGVTFVGEGAFGDCEGLKRVVIPASLTEIGEGAFSFCAAVTDFEADENNGVYCVKDGALYDKTTDTVVRCGADGRVPDGTKIFGEASFDGGEFTELHIPASVIEIRDRAFFDCDKLEKLTVDEDNPAYACVNNCFISKSDRTLIAVAGEYVIPDDGSVRIIGEHALRFCKRKSVEIPSSIRVIDNFAYGDGEFESVRFNDGLEAIGESAFTGCCNIVSLKLPDTLKSIGVEAFSSCEKLKSVNIPASVECVDENAFLFCDELESVAFEKTDGWMYDDGEEADDEVLSDAWCAADILKEGKKLIRKV